MRSERNLLEEVALSWLPCPNNVIQLFSMTIPLDDARWKSFPLWLYKILDFLYANSIERMTFCFKKQFNTCQRLATLLFTLLTIVGGRALNIQCYHLSIAQLLALLYKLIKKVVTRWRYFQFQTSWSDKSIGFIT